MNLTGKGGFTKGQSGNPRGRPRKTLEQRRIEDMAREYSEEALGALLDEARNGRGDSRVRAAIALLDRAWGTPVKREETGAPGQFTHVSREEREKRLMELLARRGLRIVRAY